jgi:hypothetical protein
MTPSCSQAYLLRQIEHLFVSVPEDAYDHAHRGRVGDDVQASHL